ncbi:hypothetical protein pipiens_012896 [Culex pipiens pipiens]|uniref:Uncharacterized protein n=1 Tax=Culex pipiens pipiens TaxID=38569 RepID=A0ABD1D0L5_CULPP
MANSTCADVRIRDEVRDVDYIVKGCTPVDICATIEPNSSRVTISCSQCSEDLCNDKPSTPARKTRTVRAASRWWSKLKDSTPSPPAETTSSKQKRGIGPWLDAGSEILRFVNNPLALFEHVNLVYGTISEFCTTSGCPDMTGPGTRMYLWFDEKGKKTRVAAPQYIDYVMTFTQKTVSDESIFPTKYANEFPSSFESIARKILRLLFHVIAHLYAAHFREVALLGLHAHLNLTFAHLTALHRRFNLIEPKETEVLRDLEIALRLTDDPVPSDDGIVDTLDG